MKKKKDNTKKKLDKKNQLTSIMFQSFLLFCNDSLNSQAVRRSLSVENGEDPPTYTFLLQSSTPF
jgi:hypothetical protein